MRRSLSTLFFFPIIILLLLVWSSCGGGSGGGANQVAKVVIAQPSLSLNKGATTTLSVTAQDSNGATVASDFTYTSSNTALVNISSTGQVCAGTWDTNIFNCTPTTQTGMATITVTAPRNNISATINAYVHNRLDLVEISSDATSCTSSTGTQQLSSKAYTKDPAVCATAPAVPCELPADTVGQPIYVSKDTDIVTVDNTTNIGKVTAGIPGRTFLYGTISNVNSLPIIFETCPVKTITATITGNTNTSFTVDKSATASLTAVVTDTKGTVLTAPPINWITSNQFAVTAAAGSPALTATATGANPGYAFVQPACTPPSCNRCTQFACSDETVTVYGNTIQGKVNGTSAGTVYAASVDSTSLVPIEVSTNTAGTAVTLPRTPNSMISNILGTRLILGSTAGVAMLVDPSTNAETDGSVSATALEFTRNGGTGVLVDTPNKKVYTYSVANSALTGGYIIDPAITHFDSSPDAIVTDAVNGTANLYGITSASYGFLSIPAAVNDLAVLQTGQAVYLTAPASNQILVTGACDGSVLDTRAANAPQLAEPLPNGDGAVVVDATSLKVLHNVQVSGVCPVILTETMDSVTLPLASGYQARQLLVSPDSTKVAVSTDKGLAIVDLTTLTATSITLGGGATQTFTGAFTADAKNFYVGADDGTVHRIDLTANPVVDAQQITVGLKKSDNSTALPQLVVIRNKS